MNAEAGEVSGKKLPGMAREAIRRYLESGEPPDFTGSDPELDALRGLFVTLKKGDDLRGCIGMMEPSMPLGRAIGYYACAAAFQDARFSPVTASEMKDIEIEVSLLSPLERVKEPSSLVMGTHGVVVKRSGHSGVFLPQVATETGWSREEFLGSLCSHKAGLPEDAWKDPETELYSFTVEIFHE